MSVVKVEATKAKSAFSDLQVRAKRTDLAITRHGHIQAYVVSPDRYKLLKAVSGLGQSTLQKLDEEFDAIVARMQDEPHRKAVHDLETLPLGKILARGALAAKPSRKAGATKTGFVTRKARSA